MQLGGVTIPTTIDNHGRYLYRKDILGYNADAEAIESVYATITWTFPYMDISDFDWICNTLLQGNASRTFTSGQVKNAVGTVINLTSAVAYRPTYEYASGNEANSVLWEIKRIR